MIDLVHTPHGSLRRTTMADVNYLATRLRDEDVEEVRAASNAGPRDALQAGLLTSRPCLTIVDKDGAAVAMLGVIPDTECAARGFIWMLASPDLIQTDALKAFVRQCRYVVDRLGDFYPTLIAISDERNPKHHTFLEWCGFELEHVIPHYGANDLPFLLYKRLKPCAIQ